jgi:voltage-gated sodium channel
VIAGICVGFETDRSLSPASKGVLSSLNQYFLKYIFLLELVIKIVAEGLKPWRFFSDNWNNFDFVVVIMLLIPFQKASTLFVLRLLRVFRVLKIMTALPVRRCPYLG